MLVTTLDGLSHDASDRNVVRDFKKFSFNDLIRRTKVESLASCGASQIKRKSLKLTRR